LDVSIIIVNWNTRTILYDCIKAVYERAGDIEYEVIVIDNASTDGSPEMVRKQFPRVILIANDSNCGYAGGMNQGMKIASGRYYLLLNSDIIICDRAVEKTLRYIESHQKVAVVGCQVIDDSGEIQMSCFRFPSLLDLVLRAVGLSRLFKNNRFFGRESMAWWKRDTERKVDVVTGMFMFARREAVEKVGLMDENFFFYSEDVDWCYRFSLAGWENVFWHGAQAIHLHGGGQSSAMVRKKSFVEKQKNILLYFRKHKGLAACLLARMILSVLFVIRWIGWTVASLLTGPKNPLHEAYIDDRRLAWAGIKYYLFGLGPKGKW
jgi:GT2 family glycosyltransferase